MYVHIVSTSIRSEFSEHPAIGSKVPTTQIRGQIMAFLAMLQAIISAMENGPELPKRETLRGRTGRVGEM